HRRACELAGQPANAVERIGRVERDLDQRESRLRQSLAHAFDLVGPDAAQDRDEGALRKGAPESRIHTHSTKSHISRMPATNAAWLSTIVALPPNAATA